MNYHNITKEDMNNGDGLRTVLWVAGCEHHCKECQNPVTWDPCGGIPFDDDAMKELMESIDHDYISGITFSGGDPLATYNRECVLEIIKKIRKNFPKKSIWVYSGYTFNQLLKDAEEILKNIDVLVDGQYHCNERDVSLKWRGSTNQNVIDVQETLKTGELSLHCD